MKISENFFKFFSTLNQYFPHIPYVASKNTFFANFNRLPKIYDNFDRPTSLGFVFRTISTSF
jgi:hypothetical protein